MRSGGKGGSGGTGDGTGVGMGNGAIAPLVSAIVVNGPPRRVEKMPSSPPERIT